MMHFFFRRVFQLGLFVAVCVSLSLNNSMIAETSGNRRSASVASSADKHHTPQNRILKQTTTVGRSRVLLRDLPNDIKLCRLPIPEMGQPRFNPRESPQYRKINSQYIYQASGSAYTDFMEQHLFPIILKKQQKFPKWGRRRKLLPRPSNHKSLLFVGNSHTRQMVGSLLCHYQDEIRSSRSLRPNTGNAAATATAKATPQQVNAHAMEYKLKGNVTLYVVINHGALYSQRWKTNLEELMGRPLHSLSAIVLGYINPYQEEYRASDLWAGIRRYGEVYPHLEVDLERHANGGFDLQDLTQVYPTNPIIWVPPLSTRPQELIHHANNLQQISNLPPKRNHNVRAIDSRQNSDGTECSCLLNPNVTTCLTNPLKSAYKDGHRCMGKWGGQPDLVAWDVVEELHQLLLGNSSSREPVQPVAFV